MSALAAFAASEQGKLAAAICDRWHVDPGALLADDVLGFNLRIGLGMIVPPAPEPTTAEEGWEEAGTALRREWLAGAR